MADSDVFLGHQARIRLGEGANVVNFEGGSGAFTVNGAGNVASDAFLGNSIIRHFGVNSTYTLTMDRILIRRTQNIFRFNEFMANWANHTAADMGEFVVDWVLWGTANILWLRKIVKGPRTVNHPSQELAYISGTILGEEAWAGTCGAMETLTNSNRTQTDNGAVDFKPVQNQGGLVLLTYQREGTQALQLQTKRGAGAWAVNTKADAKLAAAVSTAGSACSLDLVVPDLEDGDQVRIRYPSGTAAGNQWSGRLGFCAPDTVG